METEAKIKHQPKSKTTFYILMSAGTAILLATPIVGLSFFGLYLDNYLQTKPTFLITAIVVGSIGGIYNVYKLMKVMK